MKVLQEPRESPRVRALEKEIRGSARVRGLLRHEGARFRPGTSRAVCCYWQGTHWVLASLAELGYPAGDPELLPLREKELALWLKPSYERSYVRDPSGPERDTQGVPIIEGRHRRGASQQGNALYALVSLGFEDQRADLLVELLRKWQWRDGGWNCDRRPSADTYSFMETLTPMMGLAALADRTGSCTSRSAARRAAEVFLSRRLFLGRHSGKVIRPDFLQLHYPRYWHYDVLGGLKGVALAGKLRDPRCGPALDWLEERELEGGGWSVDATYYRVWDRFHWNGEHVDWGAPGADGRNEWVTTDALAVLREAGRLHL